MSATPDQGQYVSTKLSDISVDNENTVRMLVVAMLNMAAYILSMEESSKCWECVRMFMKQTEGFSRK